MVQTTGNAPYRIRSFWQRSKAKAVLRASFRLRHIQTVQIAQDLRPQEIPWESTYPMLGRAGPEF
jgi:hypothetical protein